MGGEREGERKSETKREKEEMREKSRQPKIRVLVSLPTPSREGREQDKKTIKKST